MIERLGDLNDKFFQLYGELHYNEELLTNEQSRFMAKCLFEQYITEYQRLLLSCGIEENKEMLRLKMLNGAYTPRKRFFFKKNRALKQLIREVSEEVESYFRDCDRRLQEYINARDAEEDGDEEITEEEQTAPEEESNEEGQATSEEEGDEEEPANAWEEAQEEESIGEIEEKQEEQETQPTAEQEEKSEGATTSEQEQQQEEQAADWEENSQRLTTNEIVVENYFIESDGQEQTEGQQAGKKRGKKKQTKKQINGQISFIS